MEAASGGQAWVKMMKAAEREYQKDWEVLDHLDFAPVKVDAIPYIHDWVAMGEDCPLE